jgi:hypothetical protein
VLTEHTQSVFLMTTHATHLGEPWLRAHERAKTQQEKVGSERESGTPLSLLAHALAFCYVAEAPYLTSYTQAMRQSVPIT